MRQNLSFSLYTSTDQLTSMASGDERMAWDCRCTLRRHEYFKCDWWEQESRESHSQAWLTHSKGVCFWESLVMCFKHSLGGSSRSVLFSSPSGFVYSHPAAGKSIWNKEVIFIWTKHTCKYIYSFVNINLRWVEMKENSNLYFCAFYCFNIIFIRIITSWSWN